MSDNKIGGKLAMFFGGSDEHRIELLAPGGERIHELECDLKSGAAMCKCGGVFLIFDPSDGATALEYNRKIERALAGNRKGSPYEEGATYIMERKVVPRQERGAVAVEGLTEDDCNGMTPLKFLMSGNATARVMIREAVARYVAVTGMGSAADSGN